MAAARACAATGVGDKVSSLLLRPPPSLTASGCPLPAGATVAVAGRSRAGSARDLAVVGSGRPFMTDAGVSLWRRVRSLAPGSSTPMARGGARIGWGMRFVATGGDGGGCQSRRRRLATASTCGSVAYAVEYGPALPVARSEDAPLKGLLWDGGTTARAVLAGKGFGFLARHSC